LSSSFGGSSGSDGTIRYAIVIDDSQVNSKLQNLKSQLSSLSSSTSGGLGRLNSDFQTFNQNLQGTSSNIQSASQGFSTLDNSIQSTSQEFSTLDSSLQSTSQGLGSLGSGFQTADNSMQGLDANLRGLDNSLQTTGKDADAINSNFKNMDSSIQSTSGNMGALNSSFKDAQGGLTQFNTLQGQAGQSTQTLGDRLKSAGGFAKDNALAIGAVASSAIQLVSSYTQLQQSQLKAEIAQTNAERAGQKVVKLQEKISKLVADGKQGTADYAIAVKDLAIAQDSASQKTQKAAIATQVAQQATASFFTQLIPQGVLFVSGLVQMGSGLRDLMPLLKSMPGLILGMGGPLTLVAAAFIAVYLGTKTAYDAMKIMTDAIPGQISQLNALQMAHLAWKIAMGQATEEEKKLFNQSEKNQNAAADLAAKINSIIPIWERLTGLSQETKDKIAALTKEYADHIPKVDALSKGTDTAATSIQGMGTSTETTANQTLLLVKQVNEAMTALKNAKPGTQQYTVAVENLDKAKLKLADSMNVEAKGADYVHGKYTELTSAADELAAGTTELDEKSTQYIDTLANQGKGVDYIHGKYQVLTSAADELAAGLTETNEATIIADASTGTYADSLELGSSALEDYATNQTGATGTVEDYIKTVQEGQVAVDRYLDSFKKFNAFAQEFNKNDLGLAGIFKFDKFDSDKIAKDLIKGLPDKLEKKMKLDLKFETKSAATEEGIQKFLQRALDADPAGGFIWDPDLKIDDKSAQDIAKDIIKSIDKNTTDPDLAAFRAKLKAAVDRGASESEIAKILADHVANAPPIPVYVVADPKSAPGIAKNITDYASKNAINWPVNMNPVTRGSVDTNGLPKSFTSQFPGTYGKQGKYTTGSYSDYETGSLNPYYTQRSYQEDKHEMDSDYWNNVEKHGLYTGDQEGYDAIFGNLGPGAGSNIIGPDVWDLLNSNQTIDRGTHGANPEWLKKFNILKTSLQTKLNAAVGSYIDLFGKGIFKLVDTTKPIVTPVNLRPKIQAFNAGLNKSMGALAAGIIGMYGEETTNMFFGTQPISAAKAQVQSGAARLKLQQQRERTGYAAANIGGGIIVDPRTQQQQGATAPGGMNLTQIQTLQKALANLATQGSNSLSILAAAAKMHVTTLLTYFGTTVPVALQKTQTGLANFATQGGNSLSILAQSASVHVTTLLTYFGTTIPTILQKSQTAFANFAVQSANSFSILQAAAAAHTTSINTYLGKTIAVAAQKAQKSLANFANQGANSFSMLQSAAAKHTKSLDTYMSKTIPTAAQKAQKSLANLSNQGSNSMSALAKNSGKHTKSMDTYLGKTIPVAAQHSQKALANLSNQGSKSMSSLASATEKAASRIKSALNSIPSGGGSSGTTRFAQGGTIQSAAGGFVTHGPELVLAGDNPGGRETVAFIPHNNPSPTLGMIARQFGQSGGAGHGKGNDIILNAVFQLNGNDIINERVLNKRIRMSMGMNRDRNL